MGKTKKSSKDKNVKKNKAIVKELERAYWMEMETIQNYLANSVNLDGVRAEEIKKALEADVAGELTHAQRIAKRMRVLGGAVPGSQQFKPGQHSLQPPQESTDVVTVIRGVIEAEETAIAQYRKIIRLCEGYDYATQDLCVELLADEEDHCREFLGFLAEYES
ncbi:MAG: rubrerythrin [Proteobacteria bacterium]|nr:MAG: rubrerythrin [Pseudomonadota bacterium]